MLDVKLSGLDDAMSRLRALGSVLTPDFLEDVGAEALELVAERARELAPVRFGNLRDSIVVVPARSLLGSEDVERFNINAGSGLRSGGMLVGPLEVDAFYAWFIEFGTVNMRAEPFLIPAVDGEERRVFQIFGDRIGKAIESVGL